MSDAGCDDQPAVGDHVTVEAVLDDTLITIQSMLVSIKDDEIWLGLNVPDYRIGALGLRQSIALTVVRPGAALLGQSEFLRPLGSQYRVFAVARPLEFECIRRRAQVRYPIELPVVFREIDRQSGEPRGRVAAATTINISSGGLLLDCLAPLAPEADLELAVALVAGEPLQIRASVAHVQERPTAEGTAPHWEIGLQFTSITTVDQDRINRMILTTDLRKRGAQVASLASSV